MSVKRSITLVDEKIDDTYVKENLSIDDTGDLFFESHDIGGAPKEILGG